MSILNSDENNFTNFLFCALGGPRLIADSISPKKTITTMSGDMETEAVVVEEVAAVDEPLTPNVALKRVLKQSLMHDGLRRGLRECAKELDRRVVKLCCLATDCNEPEYTKLVQALCEKGQGGSPCPLIMVKTREELGEWAGLCKIDAEGNATSIVKTSCAVVTDFGPETEALTFLLDHIKRS